MNAETSAEPILEEAIVTPGEYLRQAREKYGLSVADVATKLNLTVAQICSLEDNRFGDLPGKTYILGYMKAYARLVGCKEAELLQNFEMQEDITIRGIKPVVRQSRSRGRYKKLLSLLVIAAAGGLMFLWWQSRDRSEVISLQVGPGQQQDVQIISPEPDIGQSFSNGSYAAGESGAGGVRTATGAGSDTRTFEEQLQAQIAAEVQSQAPVPAQDQGLDVTSGPETEDTVPDRGGTPEQTPVTEIAVVEPLAEISPSPVQNKKPVAKPGKGRTVKLEFSATSWVDMRDAEGQRLLYENVNQGRQVSVEGKPPFSVFLGNAGGVTIEYDGKPFDFSAFTNGVYARFELGTQYKNQPDR
ncbi:helix-turn-helix domain-containing protein [Gammaproteobacteria bacterium]|nr:helix-turn-helix domain-containing protein [Gammaproteobacteria bacterium]